MPVAVRLIVSGRACVNVFLRTGALVGFRIKSGGDFAAALWIQFLTWGVAAARISVPRGIVFARV